ncbi:MAG: TonB family protein [Candidatus Aminicenantes bacterium]|nr:TonB family protein [Candidatus Aminicenantes bacterium]
MKFRSALIFSIAFHLSIFALVLYVPHSEISEETTYYVDLIHLPGGSWGNGSDGSSGKQGSQKTTSGNNTSAMVIEETAGSIKDLTVKKESASKLRYPDKNGKRREEKKELISVVRKPRISEKRKTDKDIATTRKGSSQGLTTGISSNQSRGSGIGGYGRGGLSFPYVYYIDIFRSKISTAWYNSLVSPGLRGKYVTIVMFRILRNGNIDRLKLEKKSGITSLDLSALRAIENAAPFAPLPSDFSSKYLIVHFKFEWEK